MAVYYTPQTLGGFNWNDLTRSIAANNQGLSALEDAETRRRRLNYDTGDYIGGNPQFSGKQGQVVKTLAELQKPDLTPMAQGRIQFAGQTAPGGGIIDVVDGKAQLTDAGYAAPTGMGELGGRGPVPGAVNDKYLDTLGQQAEKMFLADNASAQGANKVQMTDQGYAATTGMGKEKVGSVSKGYVEKVGDQAIRQFLDDDQARTGKKQERMSMAAENIRQSLAEGYRYKGPDIRAARQILINDGLSRVNQARRNGDIAGYYSAAEQLGLDIQNSDYGVSRDHKIKTDSMLNRLYAAAPRPSGGGPGMKEYQVPLSINGRTINVTAMGANGPDAIRNAKKIAMQQYGTEGLGTVAHKMTGVDPSIAQARLEADAAKIEGGMSGDSVRTAARNVPIGGSPMVIVDQNAMGGNYIGAGLSPSGYQQPVEARRKKREDGRPF